jgi:DNA-binding NtrC family response regulator
MQSSKFEDPSPNDPVSSPRSSELDTHFFWVDAGDDGVPPPLDVVERAYVARVLTHTAGKRIAAAHLLGISYPTFLKRLRELGFDRPGQAAGQRLQTG